LPTASAGLLEESKPCGISVCEKQASADSEDSDLDVMKEKLKKIEKEEKELIAQREKAELRRKLKEKREVVKSLKGYDVSSISNALSDTEEPKKICSKKKVIKSSRSQKSQDKKVTLNSLRQDNDLKRKVRRKLSKLGFEEPSIDTSCSDTSDYSDNEVSSIVDSSDEDFSPSSNKNISNINNKKELS
jgi:vacuolar-type H+-ATPase subunit I/STV1